MQNASFFPLSASLLSALSIRLHLCLFIFIIPPSSSSSLSCLLPSLSLSCWGLAPPCQPPWQVTLTLWAPRSAALAGWECFQVCCQSSPLTDPQHRFHTFFVTSDMRQFANVSFPEQKIRVLINYAPVCYNQLFMDKCVCFLNSFQCSC